MLQVAPPHPLLIKPPRLPIKLTGSFLLEVIQIMTCAITWLVPTIIIGNMMAWLCSSIKLQTIVQWDLFICITIQMSREEDKGEEVVAQTAAGEAIGRALTDTEPGRLLQYTCKAPAAPEGYQNRLRVVYSQVSNATLTALHIIMRLKYSE